MANHASTKKAIRQIKRRTLVNKSRKSRIKTFIKKLEVAINNKLQEEALGLFKVVQSEIMTGVTKGVLKLNTASRKVSRLSARIKKMV